MEQTWRLRRRLSFYLCRCGNRCKICRFAIGSREGNASGAYWQIRFYYDFLFWKTDLDIRKFTVKFILFYYILLWSALVITNPHLRSPHFHIHHLINYSYHHHCHPFLPSISPSMYSTHSTLSYYLTLLYTSILSLSCTFPTVKR